MTVHSKQVLFNIVYHCTMLFLCLTASSKIYIYIYIAHQCDFSSTTISKSVAGYESILNTRLHRRNVANVVRTQWKTAFPQCYGRADCVASSEKQMHNLNSHIAPSWTAIFHFRLKLTHSRR